MSGFFGTLIVLIFIAPASTQVVVLNHLVAIEGNLNTRFPFLVNAGQRYQQVYASSQFTGPVLIGQIAFRPDTSGGTAFSRSLSSVQLTLSATSAAPDGLSTTFAGNIGPGSNIVFSGALTISVAYLPGPGSTRAFDIVINLLKPFSYNPALGNLLMDVLNSSQENSFINIFFDAEVTTGDAISRISTTGGQPATRTGTANSAGLITRFITLSLPEPSTVFLIGLAGTVLLISYLIRLPLVARPDSQID